MKVTYKADRTRTLVAVGVFSALAYVACVVFHFKVSFLSFEMKDAVMTIGAMLFGPMYGLAMILIASLIEAVTISSTGIYGFIMNVLASAAFVCTASAIYSRHRTLKGAVAGTASGTVAMTVIMIAANMVITPFYMGVSASDVAAMIVPLLLPFNVTKAVFNGSMVFLLYRPVSEAVRRAGFTRTNNGGETKIGADKRKMSSLPLVVAAVICVLALVFFFVKLGGSFSLK